MHKVVISGGGTGGHIFPAVAIAKAIKNQYPQCEILFVGALGRMEMEKVPESGFSIIGLPIVGIQRRFTLKNLLVPFKLLKSIWKANKIISNFKPQIAIGVGGYASAAVIYMASRKNIPCLIQEQNSYAGLTNKWLAKKVNTICVAYNNMERFFPAEKIVITGNPIREELLASIKINKTEAKTKLGFDGNKPLILSIGGSLGALSINQALQSNLTLIEQAGIQLYWQTGKNFQPNLSSNNSIKATQFITDMTMAYAAADLVISRAGAISISELCALGKACIFVPSPNVAEDHQSKNANALVDNNAAILVKDNEAQKSLLPVAIQTITEPNVLQALSDNISKLAKPDALSKIINEINSLTK